MATGMAVMGFGGGAMIGSPLATLLMSRFADEHSTGVMPTLIIMACIYCVFMMGGALGYRVPKDGWKPAIWTPPAVNGHKMMTSGHVHVKRVWGIPQFWLEDAAAVLHAECGVIAAVFDGLRDARCSAFAAHQLPLLLANSLRTIANWHAETIAGHLHAALAQEEDSLRALQPAITSGSTATVAVLHAGDLYLAWLGDSPAWLLCRHEGAEDLYAMELTQPHHPARTDEAARIAASGGRVGRESIWMDDGTQMPCGPPRVYVDAGNSQSSQSGVALTRALGLFACKPVISAAAQWLHLPAAQSAARRFLLLASDGVLAVLARQTVLDIMASGHTPQQAADALIAAALQRGAPDNASVVVLDLQG